MEKFMLIALEEAKKAQKNEEMPIGAVVVKNGEVISHAHNKREKSQNALHHAEILAIDKACKKLKSWRLDDCEIYVTLEPCPMCAGAILNARIKKVVFGAKEPSSGFAGSVFNVFNKSILNHSVEVLGGVLEEECLKILTQFFRKRR